jgi:hypothetical protein
MPVSALNIPTPKSRDSTINSASRRIPAVHRFARMEGDRFAHE